MEQCRESTTWHHSS